ncbi:MAG: FliI/YscN family ATPase [Oceanococcus sp.]
MSSAAADFRQARQLQLADRLATRGARTGLSSGLVVSGSLRQVVGLTLVAEGCHAEIGTRCRIEHDEGPGVEAEVVGFSDDKIYLMPTGPVTHIRPNARVVPLGRQAEVPLGPKVLGRVLDGEGRPIDGKGRLRPSHYGRLHAPPLNPLSRAPVDQILDVGVRPINSLLTLGRGQRVGLFAGSGVGKSSLLGMMTRHTTADVIVVGLIGERGREVRDFVMNTLGEAGMRKAVVVASPADQSPLMRLRAAYLATALAEGYRDEGKNVLLLMDSLTRFAQAQREIGLAIGEPPATRGFPPSVFTKIPQLIERAGNAEHGGGSITGVYTVLVEGDDMQDPIGDTARAILDGHIVLSRELADSGHYPAIDVEASVSRVARELQNPNQQAASTRLRTLYSAYRSNQDMIKLGAYSPGSDATVDEAIRYWPAINAFLQQGSDQACRLQQCDQQLEELLQAQH